MTAKSTQKGRKHEPEVVNKLLAKNKNKNGNMCFFTSLFYPV